MTTRLNPLVLAGAAALLSAADPTPAFHRALTAASARLTGSGPRPITWTFADGVLVISSASADQRHYRCTGATCTCPARSTRHNPAGWCWHRAAWHLLLTEQVVTDPFALFHQRPLHDATLAAAA